MLDYGQLVYILEYTVTNRPNNIISSSHASAPTLQALS